MKAGRPVAVQRLLELLLIYILDSRKRDEDTTSRIAANP